MQVIEQSKTERDAKRRRNEFIALLVVLAANWKKLIYSEIDRLNGSLLRLTDDNGIIPMYRLAGVQSLVKSHLYDLSQKLNDDFNLHVAPTVRIGVDLAGTTPTGTDAALTTAAKIVAAGTMGVPFLNVLNVAIGQLQNNVAGEVSRAVTLGKPLTISRKGIDAGADRLTKKSVNEANQQLSMIFVAAVRAAAESKETLTGYIWRLSPLVDRHCPICRGRDGNFYSKNDSILDELSNVHLNCMCWGDPVYE